MNSVRVRSGAFRPGSRLQGLADVYWPAVEKDSFRNHFGFNDEQINEAIRIYRQFYDEHGFFQNRLYPGILELLGDLAQAGKTLWPVATTKAEYYAHKTLEYLGIDRFFPKELVVGAYLDGTRSNKAEVIATVLERLGGGTAEKVMVGDRKFDILGPKPTASM